MMGLSKAKPFSSQRGWDPRGPDAGRWEHLIKESKSLFPMATDSVFCWGMCLVPAFYVLKRVPCLTEKQHYIAA